MKRLRLHIWVLIKEKSNIWTLIKTDQRLFLFVENCAEKRAAGTELINLVQYFGCGSGHWPLLSIPHS